MILWTTDPLVNLNGKTITASGAILEATEEGLMLRVWEGWETSTISISEDDAHSLQSIMNEVFPEWVQYA